MNDEPFALANMPPAPKPATFESNRGEQRVLFGGLDCLPGQLDLIETDGENDS